MDLSGPTAERIHGAARRAYGRVLSRWAMDLMRLRAAGLDRPSTRGGDLDGVPVGGMGAGSSGAGIALGGWSGTRAVEALRWAPARRAA